MFQRITRSVRTLRGDLGEPASLCLLLGLVSLMGTIARLVQTHYLNELFGEGWLHYGVAARVAASWAFLGLVSFVIVALTGMAIWAAKSQRKSPATLAGVMCLVVRSSALCFSWWALALELHVFRGTITAPP